MKYEEAHKYFKRRMLYGQCGKETTQRFAFVEAMKALEKQIPKSVDKSKRFGFCRCPNGHNIPKIYNHDYLKYCPYCSQALDWEEEDDI